MEIIKFTLCASVILYSCGSVTSFGRQLHSTLWINKAETLKVSVPAIAYAVQNNLYYIALGNIDATTYTITYQLRILTTAILTVAMLKKEISSCQWGALSLSGIGVVLVQEVVKYSTANTKQRKRSDGGIALAYFEKKTELSSYVLEDKKHIQPEKPSQVSLQLSNSTFTSFILQDKIIATTPTVKTYSTSDDSFAIYAEAFDVPLFPMLTRVLEVELRGKRRTFSRIRRPGVSGGQIHDEMKA
ncbi:Nucleotide-sugar transporter [Necator americanus]|uniref:Nucleotide-sugar transporter n=1 Tax=Necator americanus TaxID=51031 RepID=W2SYD0_NECAM|nr:Nucleotide-sugar transporter [Necator americanus]ETN73886.1 Nucleotide-sugar transporter [Necator americanus]